MDDKRRRHEEGMEIGDRNEQKPVVILDGDDTLWDTMSLYTGAKQKYVELLSTQGFEPSSIQGTLEAVDLANVRKMGFAKERFPRSLVEAYSILCQRDGKRSSENVVATIHGIGQDIFDFPPRLIDNAPKVLSSLSRRFRLVLVTEGDEEIQTRRTDQSGLSRFFDTIYVVPDKNENILKEIAQQLGVKPSDAWLVGNSVRSDINPGLRVGFQVIWIPAKTWAYDDEQLVGTPLRIETLDRLPQVLGVDIL